LTLGALVVFDAAEKSQNRGGSATGMLEDATHAARRFVELIPDAGLDVAVIWATLLPTAARGSSATPRDAGAAGIPVEG
jgi:hypothetical protein